MSDFALSPSLTPLRGLETQSAVPIAASPGPLRGTVTLTLQTLYAQRAVLGRAASPERAGYMGLYAFAHRARHVWLGASLADPYADWWLVKIEQVLSSAEQNLLEVYQSVTAALNSLDGLVVVPASSLSPIALELNFSTPHAFRAAQLTGRYDKVVRAILTARHVACLPPPAAVKALWSAGRSLRRVFDSVRGYVRTPVVRADFVTLNAAAHLAIQRMGDLPPEILSDTLKADYRPPRERAPLAEPVAGESTPTGSETATLLLARSEELIEPHCAFEDDLAALFPES